MSGTDDERMWQDDDPQSGALIGATLFDDYLAARERYFEGLRRDSEIRRLERAWGADPPQGTGGG